MDVACSTHCFTSESFASALRHIAELEFSRVDLMVADDGPHLTTSEIEEDAAAAVQRIRQGPTVGFSAITLGTDHPEEKTIDGAAQIGKQLSVSVVVVEGSSVDTPINDEARRLGNLQAAATAHGASLAVRNRIGRLTEDPDVCAELCSKVSGLGVALDSAHHACGPHKTKPIDSLLELVRHVYVRDCGSTPGELQVRVGRGKAEFGHLINSLNRFGYNGALSVFLEPQLAKDVEIESEARKLRLLLESLL